MPLNSKILLVAYLTCVLFFCAVKGQTIRPERADQTRPRAESSTLLLQISRLQADIRRRPRNTLLKVRLAEAQIKSGQFYQSEETLQTALRAHPNHVASLVALGGLYRKQYQFEKAFLILNKLRKLAPRDVSVQLFAAGLDLDRMDFSAARTIYQKILQKNPKQIEALNGLAQVAYSEDRLAEAERFIRLCLEIDPAYSRAWLLKAQIHRDRQENAEFAAAVRKAVAADPFDDAARAVFSTVLTRSEQKLAEGQVEAKFALQLNPYSGARALMGNGYTARVYPDLAIPLEGNQKKELLEAMRSGDESLNKQSLTEADAAFDAALKLLPTHIPALVGKGIVEYYRKNYDGALDWFFEALKIDADYGLAHYGVSLCLGRKKDAINVRFAELERRFTQKDAPEPPALRDVFLNYADLDPEMQKIIRLSVQPLKSFLPLLKEKHATYYLFPFHHFLWQVPRNETLKGKRTFDGRLWDDVKGNGGINATAGVEWQRGVKYLRYNVLAHEFAHQVHALMPAELKDEIKRLYADAKKERRTLDFYADSNEMEYFGQGVEAYVSEEKLPDQKTTYGHTRRELRQRDPALHDFIEKLARS